MQPDYSPWGEIQALDTIYPGIHLITAPGHGGSPRALMASTWRRVAVYPLILKRKGA